jgi:hypothetical protein
MKSSILISFENAIPKAGFICGIVSNETRGIKLNLTVILETDAFIWIYTRKKQNKLETE